MIDYNTFVEMKKALTLRIPIYFSVIFSLVMFFLILFSGNFGAAFVTLIFSFLFLFGLTYGILVLQNNTVFKKMRSIESNVPYLHVTFRNEQGILYLYDDKLVYEGLIMGANNKYFELPITEDLMLSYGEYVRKKRHEYKYGSYKMCHLTAVEMPHRITRQFSFVDIDNALDKVGEVLNRINRFDQQKYIK